jgi:hypothetical protein
MSRLAVAIVALMLAVGPAAAQEDRHALAEKAVAAGFEPQLSVRIMETYWPAAMDLIRLRSPEVTDLQLFQYKGKINVFADEAAHTAMAPMVAVLETGFTPDEIKVLIAFYESPAGKKLNMAAGAITSTMQGEVTQKLGAEVAALQGKIDAMLTADGL